MSNAKQGLLNRNNGNSIAIFHSLPFSDYQALETAVMSIVSNKYDIDRVLLLLCSEDEHAIEQLTLVAKTYNLNTEICKTRKSMLSKMTDMLVFCHPSDKALFQELSPYRDKGIQMYLVVQE